MAGYAALGHEVAIDSLLREVRGRGRRFVLPRVRGGALELREPRPGAALVRSELGVREPDADSPSVTVAEVDVFLVPGLLFDAAGVRLGRGGGHYDRLLAGARPDARAIGICYAERRVARLPAHPWDVAVHAVVHENAFERVNRSGDGDDG